VADSAPGLAPADSRADAARAALTAKILGTAADLAEHQRAELHVLHAWVAYGESMLRARGFGGISPVDARRYVAGVEAGARKALHATVAPLGGRLTPERVHLVKGYPDEVIPAFAAAHAIDTLVIGTVARSGLAGLLIGNTAERVLDVAPCSVLAIKPDGFVSPVAPPAEVPAESARAASGGRKVAALP
jgi:nucleotide-binding universal stress UspA family protein